MAQKEKGTLHPASDRFKRKCTKYPTRIKWRCQILTLMNDPCVQFISIFLCFTDITRVSEGHDYSSYYDEFPLNWDSFKLLDSIWCFFRNVERLEKFNYVCLQDDEISELGHTIKLVSIIIICLTLRKFTLTSAVRDIYQLTTKSFFQT